jgi:mannitol operon transcriptional antiterminator
LFRFRGLRSGAPPAGPKEGKKKNMEKFTARQKFILSLLLKGPLPLDDVSRQLDVSGRTIFREIAAVNRLLEGSGARISVKNAELTLLGGERELLTLKQSLGSLPKRWLLTAEQRVLFITAQLLLAEKPCKSTFFSVQLNVADGTVSAYMDKIQSWLAEKNLTLSRKRRYGIRVEGSEWNKRNALVSLIYDYKPVEELLPFVYGAKQDPVLRFFSASCSGTAFYGCRREF